MMKKVYISILIIALIVLAAALIYPDFLVGIFASIITQMNIFTQKKTATRYSSDRHFGRIFYFVVNLS